MRQRRRRRRRRAGVVMENMAEPDETMKWELEAVLAGTKDR